MVSLGANFMSDELIIGIHLDLFGSVFYSSESSLHLIFSTQCCAVLSCQSCPTVCDPMDYSPPGSSVYADSPGKNTGIGWHALLQGIFPTQDQTCVS